jgi:PKD repeat protein
MNTKIIVGMLVISALVCSDILVLGSTIKNEVSPTKERDTPSYDPLMKRSDGFEILINESFSANVMPPTDWDLDQTHPTETWYVDSTFPHGTPYCATVHRSTGTGLQDEWLITPPLDFTQYTGIINLSFWWYTSCYVAHWKDYIDLNVSVSIDNGSTWTKLWSDDNITSNYTSWKWFGKTIVLSKYAGESQVKIGFQYFSNITTEASSQEVSLDDIIIYAENTSIQPLLCDAGGPYEWCWDTQQNYIPPGVRFHGALTGQQWWKCKWSWDFGDNSTSNMPLTAVHDYKTVGVYNVTLMVIDNASTPQRIAFDYTTIRIFVMPAPEIDIQPKDFSYGIQATIENGGAYNATRVNWSMMVRWGIAREKEVAMGSIERIEPDSVSDPITSGYFFKFGFLRIEISAIPENIPGIIKNYNGFKVGPFVLILGEV